MNDNNVLLEKLYTEAARTLTLKRKLSTAEYIAIRNGGEVISVISLRDENAEHHEDARMLIDCMIHDLECKFQALSEQINEDETRMLIAESIGA